MKKIIFFLLAALVIFSCDMSKNPGDNSGPSTSTGETINLRNGLVAEYLMGADSFDTSDKGNDGFLYGPAATANRFGKAEQAYSFDGVDDYIEVKNAPSLHSDRGLTISGWLKVNKFERPFSCILWKGDTKLNTTNYSHREYVLWVQQGGSLHLNSTPAGGTAQLSCDTSGDLVELNRWLHFAAVIDNDKGMSSIYIDGKLVKEKGYEKLDIRSSDGNLLLGASGGEFPDNLNGSLDDIRIHNRALSAAEIAELYKLKDETAPGDKTIPREGLMVEYLLGRNAEDTGSNGLNGSLTGVTTTTNRFGIQGKAYLFNGVNNHISVENSPALHSDRALTITGWFYANTFAPVNQCLLWKGDTTTYGASAEREYSIWLVGDTFYFNSTPLGNDGQAVCNADAGVVKLGKWHHFACQIDSDNGKMRLYIDGKQVAEMPYDISGIKTTDGPFRLGRTGAGEACHFNGKLDDIRLYNRALTDSEIGALYKAK